MALVILPRQYTADVNGTPRVGAKLYVYNAGTNTTRVAYTTKALAIQHTQPIESVEGGIFPAIYVDANLGDYKIVVQDSDGVQIYSEDNIPAKDYSSSDLATTLDSLKRTTAEVSAGVTPVNFAYEPGDVRRYGAKCDGTTDDTSALNTAATVARQAYPGGGGPNHIYFQGGGTCLVSSAVDFSGIDVYAYGEQIHIQATNAEFNVVTSTGGTRLMGLRVHGGWDGSTAGQTGNIIHAVATAPSFPYVLQLSNCVFTHAKNCHIYIERAGYTSLHAVRCLTAGLHSLQIKGTDLAANAATTVQTSGRCQFGSCPNGYGIWIEYGACHTFVGDILEDTQGIWIGGDNRALTFIGVYQENTEGGKFIDWSTSSGIGLEVTGCFGGNTAIDYNGNWQDASFSGNSNLAAPAVPLLNGILSAGGTQGTSTTTGGVSVTVASLSVPPGTWDVEAEMQVADGGSLNFGNAGCVITTDSAHTGVDSSTSSFITGADRITSVDERLHCRRVYQNTTSASVTLYLRSRLTFSAGTAAYAGVMTLFKRN